MAYKVFIDGKEGTTGLKIFERFAGRDDLHILTLDDDKRKDPAYRAQMINDRRQVIGSTVLECDSLTVITDSGTDILPQKEFMLLYKMAAFPGKIFTRQQLMDEIWGYESESDTHTVDVHIGRLRDRFRDNKDFKIVTMRGVGYKVVKQ